MHTITSSVLLKRALWLDAVGSAGVGVLQLAVAQQLVTALELPRLMLVGTGEFMLVYAAALVWLATRARLWSAAVKVIVYGNLAWAGVSVALLFTGALSPTSLGVGYVALQAAAVALFAALEWAGLRASAPAVAPSAAPAAPHECPQGLARPPRGNKESGKATFPCEVAR
jgi:hypothetical protein